MVAVTELGDGRVIVALFVAVLLWLLARGHTRAALHWCAGLAFMALLTYVLKITTEVARPVTLYSGPSAFSFPSGHATYSTVAHGFLGVLIAREIDAAKRWLVYATVAVIVAAIAFSRLYLGAHWLSDVLGGLTLGLAWVSLLGIAYRRHPAAPIAPGRLAAVALATLLLAGGWNSATHFQADLHRYAPQRQTVGVAADDWWSGAWERLPAHRDDLLNEHSHPLTVQYAGAPELLADHLRAAGWRDPVLLDGTSWLRWLGGAQAGEEVPFPPQVHDGRNERLLLLNPTPRGLLVLRLWPTDLRLSPAGTPLWIGNVALAELHRPLGAVAVPRTVGGFTDGLKQLYTDLDVSGGVELRMVEREERRLLLVRLATPTRAPAG